MNALAERNRLTEALTRLRRQAALTRADSNKLRAQHKQAEEAHQRALVAEFREEISEGAAEKARWEVDRLANEITLNEQRADAADRAVKETEADLHRLLRDHLAEFVAEGEAHAERARASFLALEEPFRAAVAEWAQAETGWRPLLPVLREEVEERLRSRGVYPPAGHIHRLAQVPPFPLPADLAVFEAVRRGGVTAKPPALEVAGPEPVVVTEAAEAGS